MAGQIAAGAVDGELDLRVRAVRFAEEELRDGGSGDASIDRSTDPDDPFAEQVRVDVQDAVAASVPDVVCQQCHVHRAPPDPLRIRGA